MKNQLCLNGIWKIGDSSGDVASYAAITSDFHWKNIVLPSTDSFSKGTIWLRRRFKMPETWRGKAITFLCEGIDFSTTLWINGHPIGHEPLGRMPFEFLVSTSVLFERENTITLRIDGQNGRAASVWGAIKLIAHNQVSIRSVQITSCPDVQDNALVTVHAELRNSNLRPHRISLACIIHESARDTEIIIREERNIALTDTLTQVEIVLKIPQPQLWWSHDAGTPHLYGLTLFVQEDGCIIDESSLNFGIRNLHRLHSGEWYLNGVSLFIRGMICDADTIPSSYTIDDCTTFVEAICAQGFNAVRLDVNLKNDMFYTACDRAGLLVWQECLISNTSSLDTCALEDAAILTRRNGVKRASHPSLAAWYTESEKISEDAFIRKVHSAVDSTRLVGVRKSWWTCEGEQADFLVIEDLLTDEEKRLRLEVCRTKKGKEFYGCFCKGSIAHGLSSMAPLLIAPICPQREFSITSESDTYLFEAVYVINDGNKVLDAARCRLVLTDSQGRISVETLITVDIAAYAVHQIYIPKQMWLAGKERAMGKYYLHCALHSNDGESLVCHDIILTIKA